MTQTEFKGRFGPFGGQYVPETLMDALYELERAYRHFRDDPACQERLRSFLTTYAGRPTPLTYCANTSRELGCQVYLKREDLLHGGAHKLNNTLGQALLAEAMGKKRIIAETGAGQHGVASAIAGAVLGIPVEVYMGEEDIRRQALNVYRMALLGARVIPVATGSRTLKDSVNEALRDWAATVRDTYYLLGSIVGPHPYPLMVRDFQSVIGVEAREQVLSVTGSLPDAVVACVGGGSNAIGIFSAFRDDRGVRLIGVEAGGRGSSLGDHGATLCHGQEGILHGAHSLFLQDKNGQIGDTHSIAAGLDYPGVGPELAYLQAAERLQSVSVTDEEALSAFTFLSRKEGIIPALESSHAIAYAMKLSAELGKDDILVVNLSGRGDKDVGTVADLSGVTI